jgi:hypothetical protein
MKKQVRIWVMSLLAASMFVMGCDGDEDESMPPVAKETSYTLAELDGSGVSGTVTFTEESPTETTVVIQLSGTMAGESHPAHIHSNSSEDGGAIVVDFNPVDGATGRSETTVTTLNDGTPVTYDELIDFDGHVNVHKSAAELAIMIAQGDIGSNATGSNPNPDSNDPGTGGSNGNNGGY